MDENDLDALVELDGFEEVRSAIDPFNEHIPSDPVTRREYERRFLHPAGFLAAIERETGRFLGWFQLEADRARAAASGPGGAGASGGGAAAASGPGAAAARSGPGESVPCGPGAAAASGPGATGPDLVRTEVEVGYRFRPDAWGRGFATEGAAALLEDTLSRPDVTRVYAHVLLSNGASIRVMEKIGMSYVGPWSYRGLEGAEYEARPAAT